METKCAIDVVCLNHPEVIPLHCPWKKCLPQIWFLVHKRLGTTALNDLPKATLLVLIVYSKITAISNSIAILT